MHILIILAYKQKESIFITKVTSQEIALVCDWSLCKNSRSEIMGFSQILCCVKGRGQRAKKVVSDRPGLVDFAIGLVIFVLNLPDGQVLFFWEIQITEGL